VTNEGDALSAPRGDRETPVARGQRALVGRCSLQAIGPCDGGSGFNWIRHLATPGSPWVFRCSSCNTSPLRTRHNVLDLLAEPRSG